METAVVLHIVNLSVIFLCMIQRLPQIKKILDAGTSLGLDQIGLTLELWCFCTVVTYASSKGYPFLTYCEDLFLSAQVIFLLGYIISERRLLSALTLVFIALFASAQFMIFSRLLPDQVIMVVVNSLSVISACGKLKQIAHVWRNKQVKNLSTVAWFIAFSCSSGRLTSTLLATKDTSLLILYSLNGMLNLSMALSVAYFKRKKVE